MPGEPAQLDGRRVTVMGLGRFGGGAGVARWLVSQGANVLLTDISSESDLRNSLADVSDFVASRDIRLRLGEHVEQDFVETDLVVVNPAVPKPWENRFLNAARAAGVPLTTEIRLVVERIDRIKTIGVTGSAGKSTTAAMVQHIFKKTGRRSHLGGNIGGSLLNSLVDIQADDHIVLELSSAMLYWLGKGIGYDDAPGWSPHVAVLTNLEPNHLDWHGDEEHYRESKQNIFRYQQPGDHQITADQFQPRQPLPLRLLGKHNQQNGFYAITAALRAANVFPHESAPTLADFNGLPHRLRLVGEHGEQRFFDDSKSTTPAATVRAVMSFQRPSTVHLIAGGYDKKIDLSLIAELTPKIAGLYTIGATGSELADSSKDGHAEYCETLEHAVETARMRMNPDDVLLLSPGCASWDQFENYEQRGEAFARLVPDQAVFNEPRP